MPVSVIWRSGGELPPDLPSGQYELVYDFAGNAVALAVAELELKRGKQARIGEYRVRVDGYRIDLSPRPLQARITIRATVEGAPPAVVIAAIAAIGVIGVSVFVFASLREIRRITPVVQRIAESPGGQLALAGGGLVLVALVLIAGYVLVRELRG